MKKTILFLLLSLPLLAVAKPTYKITMQVKDCSDTMLLLGYHYAGNTYVCDTAYRKGKGKFAGEERK